MAVRSGHGNGKGRPHPEVLAPSKLPKGIAFDPSRLPPPASSGGMVGVDPPGGAAGERPRMLGIIKVGGVSPQKNKKPKMIPTHEDYSRWGKMATSKTVKMLGFNDYEPDDPFYKYAKLAEQFRAAELDRVIKLVGGGVLGAGPQAIIASAARQLAASIWYTDQGNHLDASKLANDARQNLLAAHELAVKQAKQRLDDKGPVVFDAPAAPAGSA
jgi:hypothetical protein